MKNKARINQLENLLTAQKESVTHMEDLNEKLTQEYQDPLDKISSALPLYPDAPSLLQFLTLKAQENGLVLSSIGRVSLASGGQAKTTEEKEQSSPIQKISLSLSVGGDYGALKSFLQNLENSSRLIEISNLRTTAKGGTGEESISHYSLNLQASFY